MFWGKKNWAQVSLFLLTLLNLENSFYYHGISSAADTIASKKVQLHLPPFQFVPLLKADLSISRGEDELQQVEVEHNC